MSRLICVVAVLVAGWAPARADEKALPKGLPPRVVAVVRVDAKAGVVEYREPFPGLAMPEKDGPVKPGDPAQPPVALPGFVTVKFSLRDGAVYGADGKKVDTEVAVKRLAAGDIVLVSSDHKTVDPAYLKVFTKDVLILVHPAPGPAPPLPGAIPEKKHK
jgi:hypothetical protein